MLANYHTHTVRCNHAVGTEREYVERAIEKGFKILGFSDHTPQPYETFYESSTRMKMAELPDYTQTLVDLREEYKDQIKILIGYEVEYFRDYFDPLMEELRKYPLDYIIQGQHNVPDEPHGAYVGFQTDDEMVLASYVDHCIEGMETGLFLYLAHPDLINFVGNEKLYMNQMERLVDAAVSLDQPLEVNVYGFIDHRNYPSDRFFQMASEKGARFVVGCDAHAPQVIQQIEDIPGFAEFLNRNKIVIGDNVLEMKEI